jgi:hypothetical protein
VKAVRFGLGSVGFDPDLWGKEQSMTSWYLLVRTTAGDTAEGPFGLERMNELAAQGRLTAESLVARVGAQAWTRAGDDPELAGAIAAAAAAGVAASDAGTSAPGGLARTAPPTQPAEHRGLSITNARYSLGEALRLGWQTYKRQWQSLVLCTLVFLGLNLAIQSPSIIVQAIMSAGMSQSNSPAVGVGAAAVLPLSCCTWVLQIFVGLPLSVGFFYCGVQAVRGDLKVRDCFQGFRRYWGVLGISVVCQLMSTCLMIVAVVPGVVLIAVGVATESLPGVILGVLLCILLAVTALAFFLAILYLPPVLVADPRMRAEVLPGSVSIAWQIGRNGGSASLLALSLLLSVVAVLSALFLFVPLILVGMPLMMACFGAAYVLLTNPIIADPTDLRRVRPIS